MLKINIFNIKNIKLFISKILDNKYFRNFIIALILINLIIFTIQTDVKLWEKLNYYLIPIEKFSVLVFTIEYVLRVMIIKNIKELFKPLLLIDLFAILPFYLSFMHLNTIFLRIARLFRIFRVFKITRYLSALNNIKESFEKRKYELIVAIFLSGIMTYLSSIFIYFAEHNTGNENFNSIISCLWWAIITMTTIGYGDVVPITTLGKIIATFTGILGVALHGIVIAVITTAFMDIIKENKSN